MLDDIDFLVKIVQSCLIALLVEEAFAPPERVLGHAAAEALFEEPCHIVLAVVVVEFPTVDDSAFNGPIGLLATRDLRLIFVTLW